MNHAIIHQMQCQIFFKNTTSAGRPLDVPRTSREKHVHISSHKDVLRTSLGDADVGTYLDRPGDVPRTSGAHWDDYTVTCISQSPRILNSKEK